MRRGQKQPPPGMLRAGAVKQTRFFWVYPKTANAPGQLAFSCCAAPFSLEIRQYSCVKLTKQLLDRALFAELAASLVFSLGVGYAYQRTGLLVFSMAAHGAECLLSNALARGK